MTRVHRALSQPAWPGVIAVLKTTFRNTFFRECKKLGSAVMGERCVTIITFTKRSV